MLPHHNDLRLDWCIDRHNSLFRGRLSGTVHSETPNLERYLVVAGHGAADGEVGILAGHAPMVTTLGTGELRIGDGAQRFKVEGGFMQVVDDVVRVVTERATTL